MNHSMNDCPCDCPSTQIYLWFKHNGEIEDDALTGDVMPRYRYGDDGASDRENSSSESEEDEFDDTEDGTDESDDAED